MYALRFSKTYGFGIMEKNNLKQVIEDKFYADEKMFCVADGVTRDFMDGTPINYPSTKEEAEEIIKKYPNPSGSAKAAEICVQDIVSYLKRKDAKSGRFSEAVEIANKDIEKINQGRKLNYTSEDNYCCAAVGGVISNDNLRCFSIGDSGIKVLDANYNLIFDSVAYLKNDSDLFVKLGKKAFNRFFNWKKGWYRKYIRKYERNNVLLKDMGVNNIGVLTGEEKALDFLMTFNISLKNAKYILVFSDGCLESINSKEKLKKVIENPESIRETKPEKTLIIYEKTA